MFFCFVFYFFLMFYIQYQKVEQFNLWKRKRKRWKMERNVTFSLLMPCLVGQACQDMNWKFLQKNVNSKDNTSNPHVQGVCIVTNVIGDLTMFDEWRFNMHTMVGQIKTIGQRLYDEISTNNKSGKDWLFILK